MSFRNILLPIDGSEYTKAAIDKAMELAELVGGRITALHVMEKGSDEETAAEVTGYVAELGREKGIEVVEQTLSGTPAEVIGAESSKYDVIVMGTLGRTGLKKVVSGSVAESSIKLSSCPVIVVRQSERIQ